ncbi:MAG: hypothetical protein AAFO04_14120 [Cyanobacteria bacterium J06592_8]
MSLSEYEFSSSQNELVGDLAKKMNFVAILLILFGVLGIVAGVINLFNSIPTSNKMAVILNNFIQGLLSLLTGIWTKNAATAFQKIVTTVGTDIENLMIALGELRKLYGLQYWLIIIALVFFIVVLVISLFAAILTTL